MQIVISPAKTLDFDTPHKIKTATQPDFIKESKALIGQLKKLSAQDVSSLMGISDKLGALNASRFQQWKPPFTADNARQAALAFKGDVYVGLDAGSLTEKQLLWAQDHLLILSGLYGLLRPLDLIQPYRLEMGTAFENKAGKNLYEFWDKKLTNAVNARLASDKKPVLVNLASNEYFKALDSKKINGEIITPVFKDQKNGQYKIISFYAKKARGLMVRYIIDKKITNPQKLKQFDYEGYYFNAAMSDHKQWVFLRDHAD